MADDVLDVIQIGKSPKGVTKPPNFFMRNKIWKLK